MRKRFVDGQFWVEIVRDSVLRAEESPMGYYRLTTFLVCLPRIVLSELNTHRAIVKNSASSRAISFKKMLEMVKDNPFIPHRFPKTHKGMQASEWVNAGDPDYAAMVGLWLSARDAAIEWALLLNSLGVSKQLVNRLLEPFLMHVVLLSATEWENFINLRASDEAQDQIRIIAELILEALNNNQPKELRPGQWHMPFGDKIDKGLLEKAYIEHRGAYSREEIRRMIAVARCAKISYLNLDGTSDYMADIALYNRLLMSGHFSPFEHLAQAMSLRVRMQNTMTTKHGTTYAFGGPFRGFMPRRNQYPDHVQNRRDSRLKRVSGF